MASKKRSKIESNGSAIPPPPGIDLHNPPPYWNHPLFANGWKALEEALGSDAAGDFLQRIGTHSTFMVMRGMLSRDSKTQQVITVKVTLRGSRPAIWRRLRVWSEVSLGEFHEILQRAFGWNNSHLHLFRTKRETFAAFYDEEDDANIEGAEDEDDVSLVELLSKPGAKMTYLYDMGDEWEHQVVLEKMEELPPSDDLPPAPECLAAANACPPDDVGGISGYYDALKILGEPSHEYYESYRAMFGENFDARNFDLQEVNEHLQDYWDQLEALGVLRAGDEDAEEED